MSIWRRWLSDRARPRTVVCQHIWFNDQETFNVEKENTACLDTKEVVFDPATVRSVQDVVDRLKHQFQIDAWITDHPLFSSDTVRLRIQYRTKWAADALWFVLNDVTPMQEFLYDATEVRFRVIPKFSSSAPPSACLSSRKKKHVRIRTPTTTPTPDPVFLDDDLESTEHEDESDSKDKDKEKTAFKPIRS